MKIAIYGIGKISNLFVEKIKKNTQFEIVYFVQSKATTGVWNGYKVISAEEIDWNDFEYLVIATDLYFDEIMQHLQGGGQVSGKVVRYDVFEELMWDFSRSCVPFWSCKVCDDIVFVSNSNDIVIPKEMYELNKVFSQHVINAFFDLARKYCGYVVENRTGYFLDIGANIGTTSIYVKKKVNNRLKVIGFEMAKQNYDLFRVNLIMNQAEDIKAEWLGLSEERGICRYHYGGCNSGGTRVKEVCTTNNFTNENTACMTTLDEYLIEHSIEAESIDYIWLDTEGYESHIINGAMETLAKKRIPLLQEYNPTDYSNYNTMKKYMDNIRKVYRSFICVDDFLYNDTMIYSVDDLESFTQKMLEKGEKQKDIFFF